MKRLFLFITILAFLFSCNKDEDTVGTINLSFKSSKQAKKSTLESTVQITDFRLSIRDVYFKLDDDSEADASDIHFSGPYEIDLLDSSDALTQTIGSIEVEDGTYKTIRFKLHKTRDVDAASPLYDRSVFVAGTIDGVPFEFWHDTSENFDIENSSGFVVSGNTIDVVVNFSIDAFLNSVHTIDFSTAQDNDNDGLIEINPDDDDDNGTIADQFKENIKMAADLIKE